MYAKSVTTFEGFSTNFEIEVGFLSSLLQLWHKRLCNFRMLIQTCIQFLTFMGIQFYNFLLSVFGHGVIFGVTYEYSRPFCEPRYVPLLWHNIDSGVVCSIWYTCQICVVGRSYILQQSRVLQVTWKSLPISSNKTKKFNTQIFRQAFQPIKASNTGIIPITRYLIFFVFEFLLANRVFFCSLKVDVT